MARDLNSLAQVHLCECGGKLEWATRESAGDVLKWLVKAELGLVSEQGHHRVKYMKFPYTE